MIWEVCGARCWWSFPTQGWGRWRRNAKWSLIGGKTQSCEGSWMNLFLVDPCRCHANLDSWFQKKFKVFEFSSYLPPLPAQHVRCKGRALLANIYLIFLFVPACLDFVDLANGSTHDLQDPWWSWLPSKGAAVLHTALMLFVCLCHPVPKKMEDFHLMQSMNWGCKLYVRHRFKPPRLLQKAPLLFCLSRTR